MNPDVKENAKAFPFEELSAWQNLADPLPAFKEAAASVLGTLNARGGSERPEIVTWPLKELAPHSRCLGTVIRPDPLSLD